MRYYSESQDTVLREDLCAEAMRLTEQLIGNPSTDLPLSMPLFALNVFSCVPFSGEKGPERGDICMPIRMKRLDRAYRKGAWHLHRARKAIRYPGITWRPASPLAHGQDDSPEKWENILQLYNRLLTMAYTPSPRLNRTFACPGPGEGRTIAAAEQLQLPDNPYYYTLLGELYRDIDQDRALENLQKAHVLARTRPITGHRKGHAKNGQISINLGLVFR